MNDLVIRDVSFGSAAAFLGPSTQWLPRDRHPSFKIQSAFSSTSSWLRWLYRIREDTEA
jgi:hypothetical protein